MLLLHIKAPFAAFRPLQAGTFRSTLPTIPPTTAYGLILNLAAIETRDWSKASKSATPMLKGLPSLEIAIASFKKPKFKPEIATLLQQLHNVPVGAVPKEKWERTQGCKPNIKPIRRDILVDFEAVIAVRCGDEIEERIIKGLNGELNSERYGVPFAGDNNFLFDELEVLSTPREFHWYTRIADSDLPRLGVCRLTTWIDRGNSANTQVDTFAPLKSRCFEPPDEAWTLIPP